MPNQRGPPSLLPTGHPKQVGRPPGYIWKEGEGIITLSMTTGSTSTGTCSSTYGAECDGSAPSGCVFSATVLEGKVFGVEGGK